MNKEREAVRAPVALAVVKLLKHLPPASARAALPAALQKVANLLKLRLQRIRCVTPQDSGVLYYRVALFPYRQPQLDC